MSGFIRLLHNHASGCKETPSRGGLAEKIWLGALAHREAYVECVTATHGANVTGKPLSPQQGSCPVCAKERRKDLRLKLFNLF